MGIFGANISHQKKYGKKSVLLGEGVTGYVHLYKKNKGQTTYAIKTYKSAGKHEDRNEYVQRASNEYIIFSQLDHPNIAKVYDLLNCDTNTKNKVKLVMQYYPNSAREFIMGYRYKSQRFKVFLQLSDAVRHLHHRGVSHRDLKMDNLLMDDEENLKIIDFGDSCLNKLECIGIVGTRSYVSPEIYSQFKYNPFFAEMWSMGIILFFVLNCQLPWKAAKPDEDAKYKEYVQNAGHFITTTTTTTTNTKDTITTATRDEILNIIEMVCKIEPEERIDADELYMRFKKLDLTIS